TLADQDHWLLFDFIEVELKNAVGQTVTISTLTQFRQAIRNLTPAAPYQAVRESNPYVAALDRSKQNLSRGGPSPQAVYKIDTKTGARELLVRFPPKQRRVGDSTVLFDNV